MVSGWLSFSTYIGILLFLVIWLGYKWKYKTKLVSYQEMDVRPMNIEKKTNILTFIKQLSSSCFFEIT